MALTFANLYWEYEDFRMSALLPFLALDQTCEQARARADARLTGAGFRVGPTFDLQIARHPHPSACIESSHEIRPAG